MHTSYDYEYLKNGSWLPWTGEWRQKLKLEISIHREIITLYDQTYRHKYYLNSLLHRLDGPAYIDFDKNYDIVKSHYSVNGFSLENIEKYINDKENLIKYTLDNKHRLEEIKELVIYNNWLSEEEFELVTTACVFL